MMGRLFWSVLVALLMVSLSGCASTQDAYDHIANQTYLQDAFESVSEANEGVIAGGWKETLAYYTYEFADTAKTLVVYVVAGSFLLGLLGLLLVKNDAKVRRFCVLVLMIIIPVLAIVITYGAAFMASYFL